MIENPSETKLLMAEALKRLIKDRPFTKITVHKDQETKSVATFEIVRIYSENKKVYVRTKEDTFEVRDRLYVLEETLGERGFVRISNSEIVNISQIEKLAGRAYIPAGKLGQKDDPDHLDTAGGGTGTGSDQHRNHNNDSGRCDVLHGKHSDAAGVYRAVRQPAERLRIAADPDRFYERRYFRGNDCL